MFGIDDLAAGAIIGSGLSTAGSLFSAFKSSSSAKKAMARQHRYNKELMALEDKYHDENTQTDPVASITGNVQGLKQNHLNPILAAGSSPYSGSGYAPSAASSVLQPDMSGYSEAGRALGSAFEKYFEITKKQEDIKQTKQATDNLKLQGENLEIDKDLKAAQLELANSRNSVELLDNAAKKSAMTGLKYVDRDGKTRDNWLHHPGIVGQTFDSEGKPYSALVEDSDTMSRLVEKYKNEIDSSAYKASKTRAILQDIGTAGKGTVDAIFGKKGIKFKR